MKAMLFTVEHKSKLLEMCKVLFPKYETIHTQGKNVRVLIFLGDEGTIIHWFEFCMTHLQNKIFCELHDFSGYDTADYEQECAEEWHNKLMDVMTFHYLNPDRIVDKYDDHKDVCWHPVDYLYQQYLTIKN